MKKYEKDALAYYAYVDYDGKRWVSNLRYNGLFAIDKVTKEVEYIGEFKGSKADKMGLHSMGRECDGKLIFFPQRSETIDIYDVEKNSFESIKMEPWMHLELKGCAGVVRMDERFWMLPRHVGGDVVLFDSKSRKFVDSFSLKETNKLVEQDELLTMEIAYIDEKIWIPIYNTNKVVVVDILERQEEIFEIDDAVLQGGVEDGRFLWMSAKGEIIKYNVDEKRVCDRFSLVDMNGKQIEEVSYMVKGGDKLFVIPRWEEEVIYIDANKNMEHISVAPAGSVRVEDIIKSWRTLGYAIWEDEHLIIPPIMLNKELVIDRELNVTGYKLEIKKGNYQPREFNNAGVNLEMRSSDLEEFIAGIEHNTQSMKEKEFCGQRILSECISS